jgi:hypothetical protein
MHFPKSFDDISTPVYTAAIVVFIMLFMIVTPYWFSINQPQGCDQRNDSCAVGCP